MTSIANLNSNFDDLTKQKSIIDSASNYNNNTKIENHSLTQGNNFKKYQDKIKNQLNNLFKKTQGKEDYTGQEDEEFEEEGFQNNIQNNILNNIQDRAQDINLTKQTVDLLRKTNISKGEEETIQNLRKQYDTTLLQYEALIEEIRGTTNDYYNRVNPSNPYLGKVIQLQSGELFYVTNQGVAKYIPSMDIYKKVSGKNGFPAKDKIVTVSISWDSSYSSPGVTMPTKPALITGTPVQVGQSVGNEGNNVYVDTMVNNPESTYVGCYNNLPPSTEVMFVPKMSSSNNANGYVASASSVYQNNNSFTGPWNAFNQDVNTWWHTYTDSANNLYNSSTGQYTGKTQMTFLNSSGGNVTANGEWLQLTVPSPIPLTRYEIQGRQGCCGNPNGRDPNTWYILGLNASNNTWNQVDYQTNISFNWKLLSFNVSNPTPYSAYRIIITVAGDNKAPSGNRSCVQISQWKLYTSSNYVSNPKAAMTSVGSMNYDKCQSYALNSGNQFFGLQSVDNNGNGNCMVSNDLAGSQIYGLGINYKQTSLWSSSGTTGSTASFNNGSLSVLNSSGVAVYATPNTTTQPSTYIGCYGDNSARAMTLYNNGSQQYTNASCQQVAQAQGAAYFGLQNSTSGQNAQCSLSNDLSQAKKYGVASNCTKISDGSWSGGGWSNAVYSTSKPAVNYYLILQDDGNMCIYLGSGPEDKQGLIWQSGTKGKQQQPNPNFAAAKGKYGKNWISSGSILAQNDFIGSTKGDLFLLMQSSGNLVLYTSTTSSKCSNVKGITSGSQDTNALYQLKTNGIQSNMSQLAYIDQDSQLHAYPSTNSQYTNSYKKMSGTDSQGNDISGAAYGNATAEQCQATCSDNAACGGFVFSNNVCYPKTSGMYPAGAIQMTSGSDLYIRKKIPQTPPLGVSNTTNNIDTISYQNYINGGALADSYGLANATSLQKQQLQQLQSKMNMLSSQINKTTTKFDSGSQELEKQSQTNVNTLTNYVDDFKNTNKKIKNYDTNVDNILKDSDIVVLQKNYDYLFWSIIAVTTVIMSMNIVKK